MQIRRVTRFTVVIALVAVTTGSCRSDSRPGPVSGSRGPSPIQGAEAGTLQTAMVAIPCDRATRDPTSDMVRSIALGENGEFFFDTGPPHQPVIGRVDDTSQAALIRFSTHDLRSVPPIAVEAGDDYPKEHRRGSKPLASDRKGGVYIAWGTEIIQVNSGVRTVAGRHEERRTAGVGKRHAGPARNARFYPVHGLASDSDGNLFVAEQLGANRFAIRFINMGKEPVSLFPGLPTQITVEPGYFATLPSLVRGASGTAERDTFSSTGVVLSLEAASGRLYLGTAPSRGTTRNSSAIEVINLTGTSMMSHGVALAAASRNAIGEGGPGFGGNGGRAGTPSVSRPAGLTSDLQGNLYIADELNHRIRKLDAAGVMTTVAGTGPTGRHKGGFSGNNGPASRARLNHPYDVKAAPDGTLYVSDRVNRQVRLIDEGAAIRAAPGAGVGLGWECPDSASKQSAASYVLASESGPIDAVTTDGLRTIYAAGGVPSVVYRADEEGTITRVAGHKAKRGCFPGRLCMPQEGVPSARAELGFVKELLYARNGALYLFDNLAARVRVINVSRKPIRLHGITVQPGTIRTVAGNGKTGPIDSEVAARLPGLRTEVWGNPALAADRKGNLFITQPERGRVLVLDRGGVLSTMKMTPSGTEICCRHPAGLAATPSGSLYISDSRRVWFFNRGSADATVQAVKVSPGALIPVAGSAEASFGGDGGPATDAGLRSPADLALDKNGDLFIADSSDHSVRRVSRDGTITTLAGIGTGLFNGDGLKGPVSGLKSPSALALLECQKLVIGDSGNTRVRLLYFAAGAIRCGK